MVSSNKKQKTKWNLSDTKSSESEDEDISRFPRFIILEAQEDSLLANLSAFIREKMISPKLKPKIVKNWKMETSLWKERNKQIFCWKWKFFLQKKIIAFLHQNPNTFRWVVRSESIGWICKSIGWILVVLLLTFIVLSLLFTSCLYKCFFLCVCTHVYICMYTYVYTQLSTQIKGLPNLIPKTSNFYQSSKIHKFKENRIAVVIKKSEYIEIPNSSVLKFRSIEVGSLCPTNSFSKLIDIILQQFLYKIKHYIRDDVHFLNCILQKTDLKTLMVTFDVTHLYHNIPHELGNRPSHFGWKNT